MLREQELVKQEKKQKKKQYQYVHIFLGGPKDGIFFVWLFKG